MKPVVNNKIYKFLLENLLFIAVLIVAIFFRLLIFYEIGGDHLQYKAAVEDFRRGINPYKYTVQSFRIETLDHGYAYFPTLLYILSLMWQTNVRTVTEIPSAILFKIPTLLADLGIAVLLYRYFKEKNKLYGLFSVIFWLFNPYFVVRYEYTMYDPIQVFFLLLGLSFLGKKDLAAGFFYALALSIKLTPVVLLPIFLLYAKDFKKIIVAIATTFLFISLPFIRTVEDIYYYLNATIFVHGGREIQGRPLLTFLTFYLQDFGINFYQATLANVYATAALATGPLVTVFMTIKYKLSNKKYELAALSYAVYFILTPIFNRTHVLWALPFFLIGIYQILNKKNIYKTYLCSLALYLFLFFYLIIWTKGFKAPDSYHRAVWMDKEETKAFDLPIKNKLQTKFYLMRNKYL